MIVQYLSSYIPTNIIYEHFAIYDLQIFHIPKVLQKINNHRKYSLYDIQTTDENNKEGCTLYLCIVVILLSSYFLPLSPMFHVGRCREHPPP